MPILKASFCRWATYFFSQVYSASTPKPIHTPKVQNEVTKA